MKIILCIKCTTNVPAEWKMIRNRMEPKCKLLQREKLVHSWNKCIRCQSGRLLRNKAKLQVCTFHDGCKQGIDQQIFNRKSISRKIPHPQSLFKKQNLLLVD